MPSTVLATALVATVAGSAAAGPLALNTPRLVPPRDGYLQCTVVAKSTMPIEVVAGIMSNRATNVTEFTSAYRASPDVTGDGFFHAEETAGSLDDHARSCTAHVTGAWRRDIGISLTAFDAGGKPVSTVRGH